MPCHKCGEPLFIIPETFDLECLFCRGLRVLSTDEATRVILYVRDGFQHYRKYWLGTLFPDLVLLGLIEHREEMIRTFFRKPILPILDFLGVSNLIADVICNNDKSAITSPTRKEVQLFAELETTDLLMKIRLSEIQENYVKVTMPDFNILEIEQFRVENRDQFFGLINQIKYHFSEDLLPIKETFRMNYIVNKEEAEDYYERFKGEYVNAGEGEQPWRYSSEEFVKRQYPLIISLYCGLLQDNAFSELINPNYFENADFKLRSFHNFIGAIARRRVFNIDAFKELLACFFPNEEIVYAFLVFSRNNPDIFPLFIELNGKVIVSPATAFLIFIALHFQSHKALIDRISDERGKEFEQREVKTEFEKLGYTCFPDVTDSKRRPTLQIDLVASKQPNIYVIECKSWDIKTYFSHRNRQEYIIRDLKGVVDGVQYTTKEGTLTEKRKPSLQKKIEYVKNNVAQFHPNNSTNRKVKGIVITRLFPPIEQYKDVEFSSIRDIPKNFS